MRVSLFPQNEEVVGILPKVLFPRGKLSPGRRFTYVATKQQSGDYQLSITLPPLRKISAKEFAEMKRQVEKIIPNTDD